MLELESYGSKIVIKKNDNGYNVKFEVSYDSDNDDTVSYILNSQESIDKLLKLFNKSNIRRLLTDNSNIELLVGVSILGSHEIFFSLTDYGSDEKERDTKKIYSVNINNNNNNTQNYDIFDALVQIVKEDINILEEDNEHKFNSTKY